MTTTGDNPFFIMVQIPGGADSSAYLEPAADMVRNLGGRVRACVSADRVECLEANTPAASMLLAEFDHRDALSEFWSSEAHQELFSGLAGNDGILVIETPGLPYAGWPDAPEIPTTASVSPPSVEGPPAYMIVQGTGTDADRMDRYRDIILPLLKENGAYYVAFEIEGNARVLHGEWPYEIFAISRWPDCESGHTFWDSDRYQNTAIPMRAGAGVFWVHFMPAATPVTDTSVNADRKTDSRAASRRQFIQGAAAATGGLTLSQSGLVGAATDKPPLKLNLKGYSIPLTPEGKASLVTPTPHHYGGQFIFVDYRADVKEVARFLPAPLEPEPTGRAFVIVNELFSIPEDNPDLIYTNPERTHYTEGVVAVRCSYRGTPGSYITAIWVSKDWSMAFGQFFGWPKKIASIHLTRVPPLHPTLQPLGVGSRVRGIVAREGYRLLDVSLELRRQEEDSAAPSFGWLYSVRHFPEMGPTVPAIKQLIRNRVQNPRAINVYSGDAEFSFGASDNEELLPLKPVEIIKGYFYNPSWTTTHTAELLETYA